MTENTQKAGTDASDGQEALTPISTMVTAGARYIHLDALRGFAVMGILAMNILAFGLPASAIFSPAYAGDPSSGDLITWIFGFIFVDGKMRGLFSLLFGASMMMIILNAQHKGQSPTRTHYMRMLWLAIFALFHFFFIWFGDILLLYAIIGCIAYLFRNMAPANLIKWAIGIYIFGFLLMSLGMGSLFVLQMQAENPAATAQQIAAYQETIASLGLSTDVIAREITLHRSGFWEIFTDKFGVKLANYLNAPLFVGFETLPLMMLGMALMRNGFLIGEKRSALYRKLALFTLIPGIILSIALTLFLISKDFEPLFSVNAMIAWTYPSRLMMTIGYTALLVMIINRCATQSWLRRVAATGRVAFTNYLGTSVMMTAIFYGWGLGLFGMFSRAELWLFVLGGWAVMLLWSQPWLMRNRYGPLEWLWRSLARWEIQSLSLR